jgi:hypothetical protein
LPRPSAQDIKRLLDNLNGNDRLSPETGPSVAHVDPSILFDTQNDSPMVRAIVEMVALSLEYNPRRIKQFINGFRLAAIVASRTGLFGPPRDPSKFSQFTPEQLGKLIAISLRWPLLLTDAAITPGLLEALQSRVEGGGSNVAGDFEIYWNRKTKLRQLLAYGLGLGSNGTFDPKYSLEKLDLQRYLQVSPPIAIRKTRAATSGATSQKSNLLDDTEFVHFEEEEINDKNDEEEIIEEEGEEIPQPSAPRSAAPSEESSAPRK